jgi:hypothetical protein
VRDVEEGIYEEEDDLGDEEELVEAEEGGYCRVDVVFVGGFDELGLDLTVEGLQFYLVQ